MLPPDWPALGAAVKGRRQQLRLPQDLRPLGGPAAMTVRRIERAEIPDRASISPNTKSSIEALLQWESGLVDRILNGSATDEEIYRSPLPDRAASVVERPEADEIERQRAQFERGVRADPSMSNLTLAALLLERLERADQARTPRVVELIEALHRALSELNPRAPARQAEEEPRGTGGRSG